MSRDAPDVVVEGDTRTMSFGAEFQKRRLKCKISLHALARRAMVDVSLLAQYERGDAHPSEEIERSLLRLLDHVIEEQATSS